MRPAVAPGRARTPARDASFDARPGGRGDRSMAPRARVREAADALRPAVRSRLRFLGAVPDTDYARVLRSARFLAHNVIADNGTFSVLEAALLGCPSVSSDYPQIREIDDAFGLGLRFFDPFDECGTAAALLAGESLPPPSGDVGRRIQDRSWRSWDDSLLDAIRRTLDSDRNRIACL